MANSARRQVSIFINGQQVEATAKNITSAYRKASNELANMVVGSKEYVAKLAEVRKLNGLLDEHRQKLKGVENGLSLSRKGLDGLVGVTAGAFAADAIISYGRELFTVGVQLEAMNKKARIVFGDTLPKVTAEAEKNATAMGLTTAQYIGAAAAIQDLLVPMGFQREQAAEISTQLVNLSGALSEWTGGMKSAQEVADILASALTGEREQLKSLGIVISQADIDARLAAQGMAKLEGNLRQQAEAAATLQLVLEKSQDAQDAYAENADSMARKSAELSARFAEIKERISNALIPVFDTLITVGEKYLNVAGQLDKIPAFFDFLTGGTLVRLFATKDELVAINEEVRKLIEFNAGFENFIPRPKSETGIFRGLSPEERAKVLAENAKFLEEQQKQEEKAAKQRADRAKDRAEQLAQDLLKLQETAAGFRLDLQEKLEKDELGQALLGIERRYNEQIESAKRLEAAGVRDATATRIALELLKQQEITAAVKEAVIKSEQEIAKARLDEIQRTEQFLAERQKGRAEAQREIDSFVNEAVLTDQQNELLQLETHFNDLLAVAEEYGLNATAIQEAYLLKKKEITDKYAAEEIQKQNELAQKLAEAQIEVQLATVNALSEGAQALSGFFDENSAAGKALFLFQKSLAIAELIINLQKEIAGYAAANSILGPAGIALTAAQVTAAKIRTGVGIATILATTIQAAQKYEGGFLDVVGAQDGRTYRARNIGTPSTGLLPSYPVLFNSNATGAPVLASERGAEYFVASEDLRDPYVANLVRLIDTATQSYSRIPQFAEGGVNQTIGQSTAASKNAVDMAILSAIERLNSTIEGGIFAVITDRVLVEMMKRFGKINEASDGLYE